MATVNTSLLLGVPPLRTYVNPFAGITSSLQQSQENALKQQQLAQQESQFQQSFGLDLQKLGQQQRQFQQGLDLDRQQFAIKQQESNLDLKIKKMSIANMLTGSVLQASPETQGLVYQQARRQAASLGLDMTSWPEEWNDVSKAMATAAYQQSGQGLAVIKQQLEGLKLQRELATPIRGQSPAGKIQADLQAGLLTPEQAQKAMQGQKNPLSAESAKTLEIVQGGMRGLNRIEEALTKGGSPFLATYAPSILQFNQSTQDLSAGIQDVADSLGRLRSGGAITADEEKRFRQLTVSPGQKAETIKKNIAELRNKFNGILNSLLGQSTPKQESLNYIAPNGIKVNSQQLENQANKLGISVDEVKFRYGLKPTSSLSTNKMYASSEYDQIQNPRIAEAGTSIIKQIPPPYVGDDSLITPQQLLNNRKDNDIYNVFTENQGKNIAMLPKEEVKQSPYYSLAQTMLGKEEYKDNAVLAEFIRKSMGINIDPSKIPWCAAFVNSVLQASGIKGTGGLTARSFLSWGESTSKPTVGDIVVLKRTADPTKGHVGFYAGTKVIDGVKYIQVLGGNQDDSVKIKNYPAHRLLDYRKPPSVEEIQTIAGAI